MQKHKRFMKIAIDLAKKGLGSVYPNPPVGCVIVKDGKIAGKGWHEAFGSNHAEVNALLQAGGKAKGADLYVTLEPCNSYGKRPPCTKAIIEAGIKKVYFAASDPNVSGAVETLKNHGVCAEGGLLKKEARPLLKNYLRHLKEKPKVSVKAAMTLDGKIASKTYDSKWITSKQSRDFVHKLRTRYDAVLVGTNTALKDNPGLTSYGKGKNPVRAAIDFGGKLNENLKLLDGSVPTIILCDKKRAQRRSLKNVLFVPIDMSAAKKDFSVIIKKLNDLSLKSILIEGGGEIISSALFSKCVDDIYLFAAPKIIGGKNAISVVGGTGVEKISEAVKVKNMKVRKIGGDFLITAKIKK
ncbi:MAG: bifunctional diaminohydroxyphosphoribosylaminopyrimidine deaminase/5-amino-6-(5-phosphoribosylamino)uracil reductase RibD [Endomicrobium sp.]|jgi:diaminohydroxyphosphoribosylaminopyrimidine deaminase/5-amino-6-(5-phosphoribosylamino)uracil reductase|nr:bifunctional diaminohydroxyphosphoribosylaminopyrimidine deaminase/5-amino-6-(5-phosphoribosylamino)uracil reductase RibD [Endomicrobium sp.]